MREDLDEKDIEQEEEQEPRKTRKSRNRNADAKDRVRSVRTFWAGIPKPIRWFLMAFGCLWLSGIAVQIVRGDFDPMASLMHLVKAVMALFGFGMF